MHLALLLPRLLRPTPTMETVKLTTPWAHDYIAQTPDSLGIVGNYRFEINNNADEADYWIVWGGLGTAKKQTVKVPPGRLIYITDEAHNKRYFHQGFLNQFATVLACRKDLTHRGLVNHHEFAPWYFGMGYNQLAATPRGPKPELLSIVMSNLLYLDGHIARYGFGHALMGHFKERLAVFGRGFNQIADKFEGLYPFQYSVALENSAIDDYITEKIQECYLAYTMPIYYGAPNIGHYFDLDSMISVDVADYRTAIERIEFAIAHNWATERAELIAQMRQRVLTRYHIFPAIASFLASERGQQGTGPAKPCTIVAEAQMWQADHKGLKPLLRRIFLANR